jgi:serralysin
MAMTVDDTLWLDNFNEFRAANGLDPVGYDEALDLSAKQHSDEVLATDQFVHEDDLFGSIANAGFQFRDGNGNGFYEYEILENHGYGADDGADLTTLVLRQQAGYESSPSHLAAMKDPDIEVVGFDITKGDFQGTLVNFSTMRLVDQERASIVMGTVINDADGDRDYDIGEGLGGRTVTATNTATNQTFTATTNDTGYYDFENLGAGTYSLTTGNLPAQTVTVDGDRNAEVNFYNPDGTQPPAPETFNFTKTAPAPIIDYDAGDILNFSAIDANVKQAGNQAFSWSPQTAHTGKGELWIEYTDFDNDGDLDTAFMANDHSNRQWVVAYDQDDLINPGSLTPGVDLYL